MNIEGHATDIVQTMREPVLVLDAELRVKAANRSFYETFQVTREESPGRLLYELGNGQWDIPALRKLLDDVLPTHGEFNNYRVEHDFPVIGRRTMLLNARRLRDENETTKLILLVIEDITDRRAAEQAIGMSEVRYRRLFESAHDGILILDAKTAKIVDANPFMHNLLDYPREFFIGKELWEIGVFHDREESKAAMLKLQTERSIRLEYLPLEDRGGRAHPVEFVSNVYDEGGHAVIQCNIRDISERKGAERALRESEERYRKLFQSVPTAVFVCDREGVLQDYNRRAEECWGRSPRRGDIAERYSGSFKDYLADGSPMPPGQSPILEVLRTGRPRENVDMVIERPDRSRTPVLMNSFPLTGLEGEVVGAIACFSDVTQMKRFERERESLLTNEQASRMEAEAANRIKDIFLATLSHEVRTPLNAILGWASILRDGKCEAAELREGMEVIERNCKAQAQLIEDVLDISCIVSGKLRLELHSCELEGVINAAIDVVRPGADAKGVRIEKAFDHAVCRVSCDSNRMQQVVWNLLSNAVKFTPKGKTVRVTLGCQGSMVRIQVSDEGLGIRAEFLPYVFDRFRQADSSTRRKFGGLGLGLSIVKHLVELHGGTVSAQSPGEGGGATFTVNLPVRAVTVEPADGETAEGSEHAALPDVAGVRLDGLRVLVVDDEADARRLLMKVLGDAGAIVTAVDSTSEALAAMAIARPQVLVSDIAMPGEDGYDLIRQLRGAGYSAKDLPAAALTAFAHQDDRRRMLTAGFQIHVPKPVDPHELTVIVASLGGRTRSEESPGRGPTPKNLER